VYTDLGMIHGTYGLGSGYVPAFPLVFGYEYVGRVTGTGQGAGLPAGTRVVGSAHLTCGECAWCARGRSMLCERRKVLGLDVDSVFAERFVVPERNLAVLPPGLPGQLAEPFAVAAHAVDTARLSPDDDICVIGPGTVGLLTLGALVVITPPWPAGWRTRRSSHERVNSAPPRGDHRVARLRRLHLGVGPRPARRRGAGVARHPRGAPVRLRACARLGRDPVGHRGPAAHVRVRTRRSPRSHW
jgi:hypothetical protein